MTLKHVLKLFSKTEVQEDKTHPTPPLEREGALGALNNAELYPLPLEQASRGCKAKPYPFIASAVIGEREELLCERSELSNSCEGYISCAEHTVTVFPPFTTHFSQLCLPSPDAVRHPLPREGNKVSCVASRKDKTHPNPPLEREGVNISCAEHTEKHLFSYSPIHLFTFKKCAFTLAEVLITLGIIGVVAALTLPAVIKNKENMELQSSLQRAYSTLNQALLLYQNDNGIPLKPEDIGRHQLKPILLKYIKNAKDCGSSFQNRGNVCTPNQNNVVTNQDPIYKTFDGGMEIGCGYLDDGHFIMNNSMFVMFENNLVPPFYISVDINGVNKKPNRLGQDLFMFQINDDGRLLPMGANGTRWSEYYCQAKLNNPINGAGCTNKALNEKDFFKKLPK